MLPSVHTYSFPLSHHNFISFSRKLSHDRISSFIRINSRHNKCIWASIVALGQSVYNKLLTGKTVKVWMKLFWMRPRISGVAFQSAFGLDPVLTKASPIGCTKACGHWRAISRGKNKTKHYVCPCTHSAQIINSQYEPRLQ